MRFVNSEGFESMRRGETEGTKRIAKREKNGKDGI